MSFQAITASFQEELDEFANCQITEDVMEEVKLILSEYCHEVEMRYAVEMEFVTWYDEETTKIRYKLKPVSELDDHLLKLVIENEASIGSVSMALN